MFQKVLEKCWRNTTGWCFSNSLSSLLLSLTGMVLLEEMSRRSCLRLSRVVASRWSSYSCGVTCWQKVNAATHSWEEVFDWSIYAQLPWDKWLIFGVVLEQQCHHMAIYKALIITLYVQLENRNPCRWSLSFKINQYVCILLQI